MDDPPYLTVGTAVSAKYKGAFCEAKVRNVVRIVKCKVTYKYGLGTATVTDDQIKGTLRVGHVVLAKHNDRKDYVEATITKIQDCSQYTVVFDDGDITTLRRTALCLKSGRHFNESETLDQLPLTHPEHFGNPVVGGRRGRRNRQQTKEDSSDGEGDDENEPDLEGYSMEIGRVVSVESSEKKRGKDNWFPGLIVMPSAQPTVRINVKDEFLIRSFKDGRYYTVPKKEVSEFNREAANRVESTILSEAVNKALKYLDNNELPVHWERNSLFNIQSIDLESDDNLSDSSDDEPCEEKDRFVAQLYKFMDDSGTPLNKSPVICNRDVDLHRLFRVVQKLGGYNRVTNQCKWRSVTTRLRLPNHQNVLNQVKQVYKKCLLTYEAFYRTLGVTMLNHTRANNKKSHVGRSLIRDKDRVQTPVQSPKPCGEKDDEGTTTDKEEKFEPETTQRVIRKRYDDVIKLKVSENSDTNSSDATTYQPEPQPTVVVAKPSVGRPRRTDKLRGRKPSAQKQQQIDGLRPSKTPVSVKKPVETRQQQLTTSSMVKKTDEEKKQRGRKKSVREEKIVNVATVQLSPTVVTSTTNNHNNNNNNTNNNNSTNNTPNVTNLTNEAISAISGTVPQENHNNSSSSTSNSSSSVVGKPTVTIGDKLKVFYGPTHELKVTYEAKVIEIDKDAKGPIYLVHYTGWNTRYDEWIHPVRIAENLSTKPKRLNKMTTTTVVVPTTSSGLLQKSTVSTTNLSLPKKVGRKSTRTTSLSLNQSNHTGHDLALSRSTTPPPFSTMLTSGNRTRSPATRFSSRMAAAHKRVYERRTRRTSAQAPPSEDDEDHGEEEEEEDEEEVEVEESESDDTLTDECGQSPIRTRNSTQQQQKHEIDSTNNSATPALRVYRRRNLRPIVTNKDEEKQQIEEHPIVRKSKGRPEKKTHLINNTKQVKEEEEEYSEDDNSTHPIVPKGRDFDLNQIRSELKGFSKALKIPSSTTTATSTTTTTSTTTGNRANNDNEKDIVSSSEESKSEDVEEKKPIAIENSSSSDDIYEFKEPEPFEFESRPSTNRNPPSGGLLLDDKTARKRLLVVPRIFEDVATVPLLKLTEKCDSSDTLEFNVNEKKRFRRTICTTSSTNNIKASVPICDDDEKKDPFDKLIESPSFNLNKIEKSSNLFNDIPTAETSDDYSHDMELSDTESQTQPIVTRPEALFSLSEAPFTTTKSSNSKSEESKVNSDDDYDDSSLRQSIQRVIAGVSSTDDDLDEDSHSPLLVNTQIIKNYQTTTKSQSITNHQEKQPSSTEEIQSNIPEPTNNDTTKSSIKIVDSLLQKLNSLAGSNRIKKETINENTKFVQESDGSGVEQLVTTNKETIVRKVSISDESQVTKVNITPIINNNNNNNNTTTAAASSYKFDTSRGPNAQQQHLIVTEAPSEDVKNETDVDQHLHSLLLCEETLPPRSPASTVTPSEPENDPKLLILKSPSIDTGGKCCVLEFGVGSNASGMSANRIESKKVSSSSSPSNLTTTTTLPRRFQRDNHSTNNIHSSSPESTTSNCSPRPLDPSHPDPDDINPALGSYKKQRGSNGKVQMFGEEDITLVMDGTNKKLRDEVPLNVTSAASMVLTATGGATNVINIMGAAVAAAPCKKRRKSSRCMEEGGPAKRGRKPNVNKCQQQQQPPPHINTNSDSDDTSEHSVGGPSASTNSTPSSFSPRPPKYNFIIELDPTMPSTQRITILQQKLSDLRKTYSDVKSELVTVERRRKKIRRREREALKATTKQEMACA